MEPTQQPDRASAAATLYHAREPSAVLEELGTDLESGLRVADARQRLT